MVVINKDHYTTGNGIALNVALWQIFNKFLDSFEQSSYSSKHFYSLKSLEYNFVLTISVILVHLFLVITKHKL